ncbi:MAG TPA: cytochrome c3 family protein [Pseudolabrys sp.]|nr:cytochrome c3 family protein [Pseudolabrys sp.]
MGPKTDRGHAPRNILPAFLKASFTTAAVAASLTLLPVAAFAADPAPSAADQACLGCHGAAGMEKKLADGDTLQLLVPPAPYLKSVHGANGCTSCHADVDITKHPPEKNEIASKRGFATAMTQVCRTCHADKFEQWESSIHAALVRSGNPGAPVCTDCHNPHAVIKGAAAQVDQAPCKTCHADIYTAYLGSMHAKSRLASKDSYAPVCSGCHTAHSVKPVATNAIGLGPEQACFGCHAETLEQHAKWLPNAALHFEVISCPACHSPNAQRKVDLMLIDGKGQARGTEQIGVPLFDASANSNGKGIDAQTLWTLMQTLNRSGIASKTVLRGRLDVVNGAQAHQLADKSKALSDCRVCHRSGSQAFQSVTISLVGPDGRRVGYGANADVLNSAFSVDSVRGFYAIGGTRIKLLDILLALAIFGGVSIAVGHVFLGWMFKRFGLYHPHNGHGHPPAGGGDAPKAAA